MDPANVPLPDEIIPVAVVQDSFKQLQLEIRADSLSKHVRDFNGEGSRRFQEWIRDIERVGTALNADDERYRVLALQTLKGPAADFLTRILRTNPNLNWDRIKRRLGQQYSDQSDVHLTQQKLRRLTQQKGESVQTFSERILGLADDAYPGHNIDNPLIQSVLIDAFIDGLTDDHIARRLIRNVPGTFNQAVQVAADEQQASRAFSIRRRDEPMEVDSIAVENGQAIGQLRKQMEVLNTKIGQMTQGETIPKSKFGSKKPRYEWTSEGKPICFFCKKIGHKQSQCYSKKRQQKPSNVSPEN